MQKNSPLCLLMLFWLGLQENKERKKQREQKEYGVRLTNTENYTKPIKRSIHLPCDVYLHLGGLHRTHWSVLQQIH